MIQALVFAQGRMSFKNSYKAITFLSSVTFLHHDFARSLSELAQTAIMKLTKKAQKHPCGAEEKI